MWDYYEDYNLNETKLHKISNSIIEYLKSISEAKTKEYIKNMNNLRNLKRKKISDFLDEVDSLSLEQRMELKKIIQTNLNFKEACYYKNYLYKYFNDEKSLEKLIYKKFAELAKEFSENIWEQMKRDKTYVGKILDFKKPKRYCPVCGIEPLKKSESGKRSPLDHFFPKSIYPFLYFYEKNLILMCDSCNSKKGQRIITEYGWMYPYKDVKNIEFDLVLLSINIFEHDYKFEIIPKENDIINKKDEVDNYIKCWINVFDLDSRIKQNYKEIIEEFESNYLELLDEEDKKMIEKHYLLLTKIAKKNGNIIEKSYYEYRLKNI